MLSLQGTIRNTGGPAIAVVGHNGGIERGKTGAISYKGSRESYCLIVVMNRRSLEGVI